MSGVIEAPSDDAAIVLLSQRGLIPVRVDMEATVTPKHRPAGELATLLSGLAALIDAGLPVDRALAAGIESSAKETAYVLDQSLTRVRQGSGLADALGSTGGIPAPTISMIRSGELQGSLATALRRAALELQRQAEIQARIRQALAYPAFLTCAGMISIGLIAGFVLPRFAALLGDLGQALPPSTRLLLGASAAVRSNGIAIVALTSLLAVIAVNLLRRPSIQARLHQELLSIPLLGPIRAQLATVRVCRSLAALLESGVPVLTALELTGDGSGDLEITRRLDAVRRDVGEGSRIVAALRRHAALTPAALQLAHYGEESGRLTEFLVHAADLQENTAQGSIRQAVTLLEPTLILAFGGLVAFVAAALLQAVYGVRPAGF